MGCLRHLSLLGRGDSSNDDSDDVAVMASANVATDVAGRYRPGDRLWSVAAGVVGNRLVASEVRCHLAFAAVADRNAAGPDAVTTRVLVAGDSALGNIAFTFHTNDLPGSLARGVVFRRLPQADESDVLHGRRALVGEFVCDGCVAMVGNIRRHGDCAHRNHVGNHGADSVDPSFCCWIDLWASLGNRDRAVSVWSWLGRSRLAMERGTCDERLRDDRILERLVAMRFPPRWRCGSDRNRLHLDWTIDLLR